MHELPSVPNPDPSPKREGRLPFWGRVGGGVLHFSLLFWGEVVYKVLIGGIEPMTG